MVQHVTSPCASSRAEVPSTGKTGQSASVCVVFPDTTHWLLFDGALGFFSKKLCDGEKPSCLSNCSSFAKNLNI